MALKKYKAEAVSSNAAPNVTSPFKPNSNDFRSVLSSALGFSFLAKLNVFLNFAHALAVILPAAASAILSDAKGGKPALTPASTPASTAFSANLTLLTT